jgi:hypothetical protein
MAQALAEKKMMNILRSKFIFLAAALFIAVSSSGCGAISSAFENLSSMAGLNETGTVIAYRAHVRSSYAVVAADLLEVKRGQNLDILEELEFERVKWYRVRAYDEDNTEGWIEAQNVITGELLEKSKKLAEEDKDLLPQATGQLRAVSNLRLSPEMSPDNILYKLENGATFDVMSWRYVPKAQDVSDVDDASKSGEKPGAARRQRSKNEEVEAAKEENKPKDLEEVYDIWYKVRLDPSISPAPSGWVFGRQVQLQVPLDIIFQQTGLRKFVAWQRLDNVDVSEKFSSKDSAKSAKPGNWVILSRSNQVKAKDGKEPDFDGIIVFGYDKYNEEHYSAYRIDGLWGEIPFKVEGSGDNKTLVVNLRNAANQMEEKRFIIVKDPKGRLRVTAPPDLFINKNVR